MVTQSTQSTGSRSMHSEKRQNSLDLADVPSTYAFLEGLKPAGSVETAVARAIRSTYPTCQVKVAYHTRPAFPASVKDVLPIHDKSNVIYLFKCRSCGCWYAGKTTQRLHIRIKQHLPPANKNSTNKSFSSICTHLQSNPECFDMFDKSSFSVLCKAQT